MDRKSAVLRVSRAGGSGEADEGDRTSLADQRDMYRMGKDQEMNRNFRAVTMFGFSMILMCSWETWLGSSTSGLINGGTAGVIYMFILCWVIYLGVFISMGEMASMAPTSGGQYHWEPGAVPGLPQASMLIIPPVSEFAPKRYQKVLSYVVGWLALLGWQTATAAAVVLVGQQIQGLIVLNHENHVPHKWQGTLLGFATTFFSGFFNISLSHHLPILEGVVLILHIIGWFATIVTLWVLSPRAPAHDVFTKFNNSGWGSDGLSTLVGVVSGVFPLQGADAAAHMSEELENASYTLPRTMVTSIITNGFLALVMMITFGFCVGNIEEVSQSKTGFAFIQVFYNASGSYIVTNILTSIVIVMTVFCSITVMASASRQLFAFARDKGVPGHEWLSEVRNRWDIPLNSILATMGITILLSLISVFNTTAFNSVASLSMAALMSSYEISVCCLLWRKLARQPLPPTRFDLGRNLGIAINIFAVCSLPVLFVFSFFPPVPAPYITPTNMNWSSVVFFCVTAGSVVYYFVYGRHHYEGPVEYVRTSISREYKSRSTD